MVVLTGATGNVGTELLRLLSERGAAVRAVSRRPPRDSPPAGVRWITADLADRESLPAALEGADRLFLLTGNVENAVRLQKNAIEAASAAGVRHVVKLSALGASDHSTSVIGVWHHNVERTLAESGVEWTILRPHVFMQNVLDQREAIRSERTLRSPSGEARLPMIDARDIAAVAAMALTEPGHEGRRYTLTGAEPISWREAAAILSDLLGTEVAYVPESEDEAWRRLHGAGLPPWLVAAQLELARYQRRGGGTDIVTGTVQAVTGRPPRSFREFAADVAEELR